MEEAIKIWRDTFKLNLKPGFKQDVLLTVTDLELWKTILLEWKKKKWNPFKINWMLSEYERREQNGTTPTVKRTIERISCAKDSQVGLSERSDRGMRDVRERTGIRLRAGSETLEEIVTKALRQNHRS